MCYNSQFVLTIVGIVVGYVELRQVNSNIYYSLSFVYTTANAKFY